MRSCPKVFAVILNYNGKSVIKRCLASVFKADYPNLEVVLVDNNSKDGSLEMARSNFSKAHFIKNEENLGFAAGVNVGIRFALERAADYVLLLNNDTEVEKDFLSKLVAVAEKDKELGVMSPVVFKAENRDIWFSGGKIDWWRMKTAHTSKVSTEDYYDSEFISGCAMFIRKDVFKKIGLFDEDFFLYWEDADFTVRARRAGFKTVIVSHSWVYHFEQSEKHPETKTYWLVVSGLLFFQKNAPAWLKPWIVIYVFLRKLKNRKDVFLKTNALAPIVKRAYQDFERAKF